MSLHIHVNVEKSVEEYCPEKGVLEFYFIYLYINLFIYSFFRKGHVTLKSVALKRFAEYHCFWRGWLFKSGSLLESLLMAGTRVADA